MKEKGYTGRDYVQSIGYILKPLTLVSLLGLSAGNALILLLSGFILLLFGAGTGLPAYLVAAIIIPNQSQI